MEDIVLTNIVRAPGRNSQRERTECFSCEPTCLYDARTLSARCRWFDGSTLCVLDSLAVASRKPTESEALLPIVWTGFSWGFSKLFFRTEEYAKSWAMYWRFTVEMMHARREAPTRCTIDQRNNRTSIIKDVYGGSVLEHLEQSCLTKSQINSATGVDCELSTLQTRWTAHCRASLIAANANSR